MRGWSRALVPATAATALAVTVGATASLALTTTWTVTPGGPFSGSGTLTLADTSNGTAITCSASWTGTFRSGTGLSGSGLGKVTGLSFGSCSSPLGTTTFTARALPWPVNATSVGAGGVHGTITGIDLSLAASACGTTVDGTRAGADNGLVRFRYSNGQMKLLKTGGNLHFWAVSGCFGLFRNGDPAALYGTMSIAPREVITSP